MPCSTVCVDVSFLLSRALCPFWFVLALLRLCTFIRGAFAIHRWSARTHTHTHGANNKTITFHYNFLCESFVPVIIHVQMYNCTMHSFSPYLLSYLVGAKWHSLGDFSPLNDVHPEWIVDKDDARANVERINKYRELLLLLFIPYLPPPVFTPLWVCALYTSIRLHSPQRRPYVNNVECHLNCVQSILHSNSASRLKMCNAQMLMHSA